MTGWHVSHDRVYRIWVDPPARRGSAVSRESPERVIQRKRGTPRSSHQQQNVRQIPLGYPYSAFHQSALTRLRPHCTRNLTHKLILD